LIILELTLTWNIRVFPDLNQGIAEILQFSRSLTDVVDRSCTFISSEQNKFFMNANTYQVWEGEIEAAELEENGVSLFAAVFSAILGIALFSVLVGKTVLMAIFGIKRTSKRKTSPSLKTSELNMSVS
jgi:hypothetical protein